MKHSLVLFICLFMGLVVKVTATLPTVTLESYDPACGTLGHNCRAAFQQAIATLRAAGGGTIALGIHKYELDAPEIPINAYPNGAPLLASSLIIVPANISILGRTGMYGVPATNIYWTNPSIPAFVFASANHSSMLNINVLFTAATPIGYAYPHGDVDLLKALGYPVTFGHQNMLGGGTNELNTFIYAVDSDYMTFSNFTFQSTTHDNDHILNNAFNLKGKGVVTVGAGLTGVATGNRIQHITLRDYNNGFTISAQQNFTLAYVTADYRGCIMNTAPGHLVYTIDQYQEDAGGNVTGNVLTNASLFTTLTEGPHTLSNGTAGGTLAIKFVNNSTVTNITSQHPEGLIETVYADQNDTFSNMTWSSTYDRCTNEPSRCVEPVIYSAASDPLYPVSKNLTFTNISLTSTVSPITALLIGDGLQVNGFNITSSPAFISGQGAVNGMLNIRNSGSGSINGYVLTPLLSSYTSPSYTYNRPMIIWNTATNQTASETISWPAGVDRPLRTDWIVSPGIQETVPGTSNNTVITVVQPQATAQQRRGI